MTKTRSKHNQKANRDPYQLGLGENHFWGTDSHSNIWFLPAHLYLKKLQLLYHSHHPFWSHGVPEKNVEVQQCIRKEKHFLANTELDTRCFTLALFAYMHNKGFGECRYLLSGHTSLPSWKKNQKGKNLSIRSRQESKEMQSNNTDWLAVT